MVAYTFGPFVAYDPTTGELVKDASGLVYAPEDTAFATPLAARDLAGVPMAEIRSSVDGVINEFVIDDHPSVNWKAGDYVIPVWSPLSILDQATAAATAAGEARDSANAAAAQASQNRVPAGGTAGQVLAKITNTDNDVGWIAPPTGGGGGGGYIVLGAEDAIPAGTPAMSPVFRLEGEIPTPTEITMLTGAGNVTTDFGSLTTSLSAAAPSNTAVGDLLIAIAWAQASVAPFDWSQSAGWTSQFEATSGRRLMIATYPIPDAAAVTAATSATHTFEVPGDTSNTRNGLMIIRVTGANLTTPVVGVSAYTEGSPTGKTFPAFTASAPAIGQLLVWTAQRSSGVAEPTITHAPGYQAVNIFEAQNTAVPPAGSYGVGVMYRITGTAIPERTESYSPTWSAGVAGLHIAIAGA